MNKEKITPYPKKVNVSDIQNLRLWADHWKHAHINVTSNDGKIFRLKEDALLPLLKGELKTLNVKYAYNLFYLVLPTEKLPVLKLKNGEVPCKACNSFGYVSDGWCPICKGKKKLDWLEQVFVQEKEI